jgi:hypothetical protein
MSQSSCGSNPIIKITYGGEKIMLRNIDQAINKQPRAGCIDMWNSFMVKDASFSLTSDIPFCPCTAKSLPVELISYEDAKALYKKEIKSGIKDFSDNRYIHFYIDDQKFDGKKDGIWLYPEKALEVIKHFGGIITPDFSTNADFPDPWKRFNTYRMRAFGYWIGTKDINVINNVRWGTLETWDYCFDGIPYNSILCIGIVASGLKSLDNRNLFELGFVELINRLNPHTIIFYGSADYQFIKKIIKDRNINIISFPSKTSLAYERRK